MCFCSAPAPAHGCSQGELERAQDHFSRALRADPDHSVSRVELKRTKVLLQAKEAGNIEVKAGNFAVALDRYNEVCGGLWFFKREARVP